MASTGPNLYCNACGVELSQDAAFCPACGKAAKTGTDKSRRVGIGAVVFVLFVIAGAVGLYLDSSSRRPQARAVPGSPTSPAAKDAGHPLPEGHPAIELPAEVVAFLDELTAKAQAEPAGVEAWQRLARARYRAGLLNNSYYPSALQALEHLRKIDPDNLEAVRTLGNIAYDKGEYKKAEDYFRDYLAAGPRDPAVRTDLASALLFQDRRPEALSLYRRITEESPDFLQAHFNLGIALYSEGKKEEALVTLKKARGLADHPEQIKRIETAIALAQGRGLTPSQDTSTAARTNASTPFHKDAVGLLTEHPIAGPKITSVTWSGPAAARVTFANFPMQHMPGVVRNRFKSRLNEALSALAEKHGLTEAISLELIDADDGKTMDRLDGVELVGAFDSDD